VNDLDVLRAMEADDAPTVPGLPPVAPDAPGLPPVAPQGPGAPARSAGLHRRGPSEARPWPLLVGLVVVAVAAATGLAWLAGGLVGGSLPRPVTTPSVASPLPSAQPTDTGLPIDTSAPTFAGATASPSPISSPTPRPSPSTRPMPSPSASPRPRLVRVPQVVGDREAAATATLRGAGFTVSVVRVPVTSRREDRRVVAQSPAGGYASPGSVVTVMVGQR